MDSLENEDTNLNDEEKSQTEKQNIYNEALKEICLLLSKMNDEQEILDFFGCLFTKPELQDFSKRWCLVKELDKGVTQREIAKKYSMSLCNITRGSKELRKEDSAFRKALKMIEEIKKND